MSYWLFEARSGQDFQSCHHTGEENDSETGTADDAVGEVHAGSERGAGFREYDSGVDDTRDESAEVSGVIDETVADDADESG